MLIRPVRRVRSQIQLGDGIDGSPDGDVSPVDEGLSSQAGSGEPALTAAAQRLHPVLEHLAVMQPSRRHPAAEVDRSRIQQPPEALCRCLLRSGEPILTGEQPIDLRLGDHTGTDRHENKLTERHDQCNEVVTSCQANPSAAIRRRHWRHPGRPQAPRRPPSPCFTFLYVNGQDGAQSPPPMTTTLLLELFAGFMAACLALWFVALSRPTLPQATWTMPLLEPLRTYVLRPGAIGSLGLLLLRLSIGVMMIHHGQEKLADPQQFADTYVASLHLPFPLFFSYAAGFSELIGSWLVILGLLTPLGALALTGTMATAAYQHILTAGLNIYVLELVVLYLGGSLALLLNGPGRFSFDAGMLSSLTTGAENAASDLPTTAQSLRPVLVQVNAGGRAD